MARRRFHLTFPADLVEEPVVHALGERFGLVTTITRAHVEESGGWVILEVQGEDAAVADAVAWLTERGVRVERIDGGPRR
jgi:ABC-type methionine transport system ATPase subunit